MSSQSRVRKAQGYSNHSLVLVIAKKRTGSKKKAQNPLVGTADFFGLNEYTTRLIRNKENKSEEKPDPFDIIPDADVEQISDPDWEVYVYKSQNCDLICIE